MKPAFAKALAGILLFLSSGWAWAGLPGIDIFTAHGAPGTGGYSTIDGPCYCTQPDYFSPVLQLQPGTYDFGDVRVYWVQSGSTPDGGPDQGNLYLLFGPVEATGYYPDGVPDQTQYIYPAQYDNCGQDDAACNARYRGAFMDFDLVYTIGPGEDAIQIGLVGNYRYTSPLPEPFPFVMIAMGVALLGARRLMARVPSKKRA